ncbi:MAG: YdiU family protein [Chloroherpetonaceae bacterium]|nr:YdiU family protein [Chloroherpetonaceae bacterium]
MPNSNSFRFDNSYLTLPEIFYSLAKPSAFTKPVLVLFNAPLSSDLDLHHFQPESLVSFLYENHDLNSFAQAYAGHQYGHFTMLGDGRAIILGEHLTSDNLRFDIQLKGSGRTAYSRRGDGKATLRAMLREYLISEAMHHLGIPSSRTIAVVKTGEMVFRESIQPGAAAVRVMKSHIRVGTFEFAARFGTLPDLTALTLYTIRRLYPELLDDENPPLSFLKKVIRVQLALVAQWMRVGFIHGVMNTDNTAISGETFDYGPCAFMNVFDPKTVYSSIDHHGRYAFGNQPNIIQWNLARFAEALIPTLHPEKDAARQLAQDAINEANTLWQETFTDTMLKKIGIEQNQSKYASLIHDLFNLMHTHHLDYTNTFLALREPSLYETAIQNNPIFQPWLESWQNAVEATSTPARANEVMSSRNPAFIPRNHLVETALDAAEMGDMHTFEQLLQVLAHPYDFKPEFAEYSLPSHRQFEEGYRTFCGT